MNDKTFDIVMNELDRLLKSGGGILKLPECEITMKQWQEIQSKIISNIHIEGLKTIVD